MSLLFPFRYTVRTGAGPAQTGSSTVTASNGREARILALEQIVRRCGFRPAKLEMEPPR